MGKDKKLKTAYTFKPKVDEAPVILEFLIEQTNFNDAVRYLIEKEIAENGVRDLAKFIPAVRDITSLNNMVTVPSIKKVPVSNVQPVSEEELITSKEEEVIVSKEIINENSDNLNSDVGLDEKKGDEVIVPSGSSEEIAIEKSSGDENIEPEPKEEFVSGKENPSDDDISDIPECYL